MSEGSQSRVFVGLGSNLDDPVSQLSRAIDAIAGLPQTSLQNISSFYSSEPVGPADQPDYINAVAELQTRLSPIQLLDELQQLENQQGRVRLQRWGARTLDLDILLYADQHIDTLRLVVPHPQMHLRRFVLLPLQEIVGDDFKIPTLGTLAQLLASCPELEISQIASVGKSNVV